MKITLSNGWTLDVDVSHKRLTPNMTGTVPDELCSGKFAAVSNCVLSLVESANPKENKFGLGILGEGSASCRLGDNFSRRKGSAFAVARALKKAELNRSLRTELWAKFWNGKYNKSNARKKANRLARKEKRAKEKLVA